MPNCCTSTSCEIEKLRARQTKTLVIVLIINAIMFLVEFVAGFVAGSTALLADSLDMLGDALVYGFSLYVVSRDNRWKAISAFIKGGIMAIFGLLVLSQAGYKLLYPDIPHFQTIGTIGLLALVANVICFSLLWRHRAEDVNMSSVWLCSRNDIIANSAVLLAAVGVWVSNSHYPDLLVGISIAVLFLHSALQVIRDATKIYLEHTSREN